MLKWMKMNFFRPLLKNWNETQRTYAQKLAPSGWPCAAPPRCFSRPCVNFTNVLRTAFTRADPESIKRYWWCNCIFYAFGIYKRKSFCVKCWWSWHHISLFHTFTNAYIHQLYPPPLSFKYIHAHFVQFWLSLCLSVVYFSVFSFFFCPSLSKKDCTLSDISLSLACVCLKIRFFWQNF